MVIDARKWTDKDWERRPNYYVYLNGLRRKNVVAADDKQGHILIIATDDNGQALFTPKGVIKTMLLGRVKIEEIRG